MTDNYNGHVYLITEGVSTISEERYVVMLLTTVINQTQIKILRKQVNWEKVLKISDFHNIITPVYYGMLGIEKDASKECMEEFYRKYRKQFLLSNEYLSAEQTIRWQLERHKIHALWLTGTKMYRYYPKQEMGHIGALELYVDRKDLPYVCRLMREMDYEQEENRMGDGIIYTRVPGIRVILYDEIPFRNKVLKQYFSDPIKKHPYLEGYRHIHLLRKEEEYVYRYGRLVEAYIVGELKIRLIINVWQYEQALGEGFQSEALQELWKKAGLLEFVKQIGILSRIWFGENREEDCSTAIELEEYILKNGRENRWLDEAILPHERMRLDFYRRDREEEWALKKRQWWFPSKKYMVKFFPILEKYPFLLWHFRLVRVFRFFRHMCSYRFKEILLNIETKWLDIKEKWKERFEKKEEESGQEMAQQVMTENESPLEIVLENEGAQEKGRQTNEEFENREKDTGQL